MKRIIVLILIFIMFFCSCKSNSNITNNQATEKTIKNSLLSEGKNMNCKLLFNKNEITLEDFLYLNSDKKFAEIPILAVSKAAGAIVKEKSDNIINIYFNNNVYELDKKRHTLISGEDSDNILLLAPGSVHNSYFREIENDLLVDSDTIKLYLSNVLNAKISIDYKECIIYISANKE